MKRKNSSAPLNTMLKMGLLCVGVLVALALTSPSPPLSDAASKQEQAASDMARAQLEQLKQEMLETHSSAPVAEENNGEQTPEPLSQEQEEELRRIRQRLVLSQEPVNLLQEEDSTLDDPALAELAELQAQAAEQAKAVEPFINQELEDKRAQLAVEEARLRLKQQSMEQLKEDLDRRLAELKQLQQAVEDMASLQEKAEAARNQTVMTEEQRASKITQVAKVFSQMKPAAAAQIFERLRSEFGAEIMSKISARIAGRIMNVMNPEKAVELSAIMAREPQVAHARQTEEELDQEIRAAMESTRQAAQSAAAGTPPSQQQPPPSQPE